MDTFNEQQLSMCETNELVNYIAELRVKNDDLKADIDEAVENHFSDLKLRETTWKEWNTLVEENEKLKDPVIHNRDCRCSQFDIKVGHSYIMDCLECVLTEEEYNHFSESDYQEKADFVCEEVARAIDNAINSHIRNPVREIGAHILDEVSEKVAVLRDSGHIYEEYPVEDE